MKEITQARLSDLESVVSLMKAVSNSVGFVPRPRVKAEIGLGNVWLATDDQEPIGYIMLSRDHARVLQLMVVKHRRREGVATALLQAAREQRSGFYRLTLRCRDDLQAGNAFWRAVGFQECGRVQGGRARARALICYQSRPPTPLEFQTPEL